MLNLIRFVGWRHLKLKPFRTLLCVLGIAFGIALYVAIEMINRSSLQGFKENIESIAGKTKLVISAGEAGFPEDKLEIVRTVSGVKTAVPMIESRGYFRGVSEQSKENKISKTETLMILGIDLLQEQSVRTYKTSEQEVIDDPLIFLNQPDSIILTHAFAQDHHLEIDSKITLSTVHGKQTFTVRGLLSPEGPAKAFGGAIAIMDIDGARYVFGKENKLDRIDVVTKDGFDIANVAEAIQKKLGPGYQVEKPESQNEQMEKMVKSFQLMMSFFSTLALLVGLVLVFNSMTISVSERIKEIGILKALGALRKNILFLFLAEASIIGLVGSILGVGLGRFIAGILSDQVAQAMSAQYLTTIQITSLSINPSEVIKILGIGTISSLIAAFLPAWKATKIEPLKAMKKNSLILTENKSSLFIKYRLLIGIVCLGFFGLSAFLNLSQHFLIIEWVSQILAIAGAIFIGPIIVNFFIKKCRPIILKFGGTTSRLANDNLIRNPRRTGSNVMSLIVGLILVILIAIVNTSFKESILNWFDKTLVADLIISSNGHAISYQSQPLHESIAQDIEKIEGIKKNLTQSVYGARFIHTQYQGKKITLKSFDAPDPTTMYKSIDSKDRPSLEVGKELFESSEANVMVSENFVLHFNKKTGDTLELETPSGLIYFKIVGIFTDFSSDVGVLYMDRKIYKKLWKDPLVNLFGVQVEKKFGVEQVKKAIDQKLGESKNITILSNYELREQMIQTIDQSFIATHAVELAALFVGLLGLTNTFLVSVIERIREIGTLRAVGMSQKQLSKMILEEAFFQGFFGALAAAAIGSWLGYIWIKYSLSTTLGWVVQFYFPWNSIGITILTGIGVSLLAGFLPARKAARIGITEALDYE